MSELRGYQQGLLERVHRALQNAPDSRVMLQLPTGGGKTRIAGELLSRWLQDGRKAVWLTHRKELAAQTEGMLLQDGVTAMSNMGWEPHTNAPTLLNGAVILMALKVGRRTATANVWGGYNSNDLMVIDEAHHATAESWARAMRQWPGPVLGMTATPWRLSRREGFDHLFKELHCGPQVKALQSGGCLCRARVLSPLEEELVQVGQVNSMGEYSELGIEEANRGRDIWTVGALRFWQKHGENRQTVVYAVSIGHAGNLANVFNRAGIPARVLLGNTPPPERAELIARFKAGDLKALINVEVATEGFDLPDAACVLLTRPTMSLALYLQMVGRGLRPKPDDGDCVILDMTDNSRMHGLPEENREWSLRARGEHSTGNAPLVRCEKCDALSPASRHQCSNCGWAFGEDCGRCFAWRAWKRWDKKDTCGQDHEPVCDLCHKDAHVEARLPVSQDLEELAVLQEDDELSPYRNPYLKDLLEEERRRISGASDERKDDMCHSVEQREAELADDGGMYRLFEQHLASLPHGQRPANERQKSNMYSEWEKGRVAERDGWKGELASLEAQSVDGQLVLRNVRERVMRLLEAEAREAGLIAKAQIREMPLQPQGQEHSSPASSDTDGWMTFVQLGELTESGSTKGTSIKPRRLRDPHGKEIPVKTWAGLLKETAEWLISEGSLTKERGTVKIRVQRFIHHTPYHESGKKFVSSDNLSNGLYMLTHGGAKEMPKRCVLLLKEFGQDPAQFHVQLSS